MKKHALLILAHNQPQHLLDMIELYDDNFYFFIHLDKKSNFNETDIQKIKSSPKVKYLKSEIVIHWGGISIIEGFLLLGREAMKYQDIGYVHLMSGQDMPIVPIGEIVDFFRQNEGKQYLHHFPLPYESWTYSGGLDRLRYYHFYDYFNGRSDMGYRFIKYILIAQKILSIKRNFQKLNLELFGGSCWCSLTSDCFNYCLDYVHNVPQYLKSMKHTFAPDELFFHTLVMNSPFKQSVVNDNLYYIEWGNENASSPKALNESDYNQMVISKNLFARKIVSPNSDNLKANIIQRIKSTILK